MRLWSLHPRYLDARGLVALWREALMAQRVLEGKMRGYRNHPQLERFKSCADPVAAIGVYLWEVYQEACHRGYHFNLEKITNRQTGQDPIPVTDGQLAYELEHLKAKLAVRDSQRLASVSQVLLPEPHPLFTVMEGPISGWERVPSP